MHQKQITIPEPQWGIVGGGWYSPWNRHINLRGITRPYRPPGADSGLGGGGRGRGRGDRTGEQSTSTDAQCCCVDLEG